MRTSRWCYSARPRLGTVVWGFLAAAALAGRPAAGETNLDLVVERGVPAAMRDGVMLRADIHRPSLGGPHPVLVMRTPYGKHKQQFQKYVQGGYIVVCQDVRGRYASEGDWESWLRPANHDAEDGYDTVQWAATLPGASGKVGTIGFSYSGFLQWRLAALRPPALAAMSAHSIPARYPDLEQPGTIRPGRRLRWWIVTMMPEECRRRNLPGPWTEAEAAALWDAGEGAKWLGFLPWGNLPSDAFGDDTALVKAWLQNPAQDPWKLDQACKDIAVPNLEVTGWYDHAKGDMTLQQTLMKEGATRVARQGSRMVIGPWSHFPPGGRRFETIDFGPAADLDLAALEIRWFDYWLKGEANGVDRDAPVKIFVMGDNRWRDEREWPPRRAVATVFFLGGTGPANTPAGRGRLATRCPPASGKDEFDYDPRNPVPTLFNSKAFTCAADQRPLSNRQDILVYQTDPLSRRIEVTGIPTVELYAASSAPDTDWVVRLIDVAPDGLARDVSMGFVRARFRAGLGKPQFLEPGEVVKYSLVLGPTSNAFLPGHRIRLDVTSSDFPNYDRNHNTRMDPNFDSVLETARQTIWHGGSRASKLILPVIP